MLHWQGDGYALFYKRLEKGTYELPVNNQITSEQVLFLLQGVIIKSVKKHPPFSVAYKKNYKQYLFSVASRYAHIKCVRHVHRL